MGSGSQVEAWEVNKYDGAHPPYAVRAVKMQKFPSWEPNLNYLPVQRGGQWRLKCCSCRDNALSCLVLHIPEGRRSYGALVGTLVAAKRTMTDGSAQTTGLGDQERFLPTATLQQVLGHGLGSIWFSSLDLRSGYYQVPLSTEARPQTPSTRGRTCGSSRSLVLDFVMPLPP